MAGAGVVGVGAGGATTDACPTLWPEEAAAEIADESEDIQALEICEAPETPLMFALWEARASLLRVGIAKLA